MEEEEVLSNTMNGSSVGRSIEPLCSHPISAREMEYGDGGVGVGAGVEVVVMEVCMYEGRRRRGVQRR